MKKINKNIIIITLLLFVTILCALLICKIVKQDNDIQKYSEQKLENIPTTEKVIKNIIFMIGDGMGENHILAGEIYKGDKLNIQKITDKSYVTTYSTEEITDSAAAATALATGYKTNNRVIGKDPSGNNIENLVEYANKRRMKTGIVCTQILNHATPAGFTVHNIERSNYDEIALSQIESCVDLMFGGGREYFSKYKTQMSKNNFTWINSFSDLSDIDKESKVIGTFADKSISEEENRISLSDLTQEAISRLENDKGFFLMIEGSNIDVYSHEENLSKTLKELIDFDDAVKIAKKYVDKNPDTLLIITADHETGGLNLDGVTSANQLNNSLYTSGGEHTSANVLLYAYGIGAEDLTQYNVIDNTYICKFIKQGIKNNYLK